MILFIGKRLIDPAGFECSVVYFDGLTVTLDYAGETDKLRDLDVVLRDEIDENWKEK